MDLFDPVIHYIWEGLWPADHLEAERRIYTCELVSVVSGKFNLKLDKELYVMQTNSVAIIPPNCIHESWTNTNETTFRRCLHFDWNRNFLPIRSPISTLSKESYNTTLQHHVPGVFQQYLPLVKHNIPMEIRDCIDRLFGLLHEGKILGHYLLWPVLRALITADNTRFRSEIQVNSKSLRSALKIKNFIDQNYSQSISLEDLCRISLLTNSHLCVVFKQLTGKSPIQYLNDLRLHHAYRLLKMTQLNITEVGLRVGIPDANYFSRQFRKKFGFSPSKLNI